MRIGRSTFVVYSVILVLAAGLAVYALKPGLLRDIPYLGDLIPPEDLIVTVRRSSDGKHISIKGDSTFDLKTVNAKPISITLIPTAGAVFSSRPKTYKTAWRETGRVYDPVNRVVISEGSYSFEVTIHVAAITDYEVQVDVGDFSQTYVLKSPVM